MADHAWLKRIIREMKTDGSRVDDHRMIAPENQRKQQSRFRMIAERIREGFYDRDDVINETAGLIEFYMSYRR